MWKQPGYVITENKELLRNRQTALGLYWLWGPLVVAGGAAAGRQLCSDWSMMEHQKLSLETLQ